MNKNEYEEAVFKSGMSAEAKLVLLAYLHHCKQQELKEVWPSQSRISEYTGLVRDTVKTYVGLLVDSGWLIEGKKHEGNIQGYTFSVADTFDNRLAKKKRKSAPGSLDQLRKGSATDLDSVAERIKAVAESKSEQLPNGSSSVAETGSAGKEEEKNNIEKKEKTARSAPGQTDNPNPFLAISSKDEVDLSLSDSSLAPSAEPGAAPIRELLSKSLLPDLALSLFSDPEWKQKDERGRLRDERSRAVSAAWVADEQYQQQAAREALEASVTKEGHNAPQGIIKAGRENPSPVDEALTHVPEEPEW